MTGEEIKSGDYFCTDEGLQNTISLAYCGSLYLQCNLHITKMPLKPKRSHLRCQLFSVAFLENSCIKCGPVMAFYRNEWFTTFFP
jgi:hypothetical protein